MVFNLPKIDDAKYDNVREELKEKMFLSDYDRHEKHLMEYKRNCHSLCRIIQCISVLLALVRSPEAIF
jgi:hypothetical protein